MRKNSRKRSVVYIILTCALFFFSGVVPIRAATYYVATTGSDSNPGTTSLPWRNPQRCTQPPIVAGDTCLVGNGIYTMPATNQSIVVYVRSSSVQGSPGRPITIKSLNTRGAVISVPGVNSSTPLNNTGFYIESGYYVVEGFEITGGTGSTNVSNIAIAFMGSGAVGGVARNNYIHDIGRTVCSNSGYGFDGIMIEGPNSITVEGNIIHGIGRLRNGENGCSTTLYQNDHGIYIKGGSGHVIRRNVIYDTNRGFPLHFYGGGVTNTNVYNNTISGKSPTGLPAGQVLLGTSISTAMFQNNIFCDTPASPFAIYSLSASGVSIDYNLTDNTDNDMFAGAMPVGIAVGTHNLIGTSPGFVDWSGDNYQLSSGSRAIDSGVAISGEASIGAPDIGAYEYGGQSSRPKAPTGLKVQ